jgi:hypothetical protein
LRPLYKDFRCKSTPFIGKLAIVNRWKERNRQIARHQGIVKVYETNQELEYLRGKEKELVAQWQPERIAALKDRCKVPVSRIVALLGITASAFSKLASGDFTPSGPLCLRMGQLEEAADAGELHSGKQVIPSQREMRRRMSAFRSWWFNRPPTAEFPLVSVEVCVHWGKSPYEHMRLPVKPFPKLRLQKFDGLVNVVRTITVAIRKLAQANARLYWTQAEGEFWERYARDTLPEVVLGRQQIIRHARSMKGK